MQQQACSSESRAFFVIDSLTPGCWVWAQQALLRMCSTLAVTLKQPCPVGVAVLHKGKAAAAAVQLQVVLRLSHHFQAKEFMTCIKRLPAANLATGGSDGSVLGRALVALLQHMQKLPARPDCHNHLFLLSSSFAGCVDNPRMQKVLQFVSMQSGFSIHFLQLTGPEAELQADAGADRPPQQQQQQQQLGGLGDGDSSRAGAAAFRAMLKAMGNASNITYDAFVADCEAVTDLMCQSWLRELLASPHSSSNSSSNSPTAAPDLLLHFGAHQLPCRIQQHILQLDPWLLPAHLCPCHHIPMQPAASSSSVATAHAAAAAAAGDARSMAALLLLPEAAPWSCCITGQPISVSPSSCPADARILQLGRHTQLSMPPTAAAAPAVSKLPHELHMLQALALPAGEPCSLRAQHVTPPSAVDSMLVYGMPLLMTPTACSSSRSRSDGGSNSVVGVDAAETGIGMSNQGLAQQQQQAAGAAAAPVSASDAAMLMRALCQLLLEQQQVLLASSNHDLFRRIQLPLQQWYMLQPAADGSGLLLRCVASREQLLPPAARDPNNLGSTLGGSAAAAEDEDLLGEQVVLLDAEQLESVRASLAGLQLPVGGGSNNSSGGSSDSNDSKQPAEPLAGSAAGEATAADAMACEQDEGHSMGAAAAGVQPQQPLLLSCGLDAWVSAVLEASSGTYTPPAAAAPPAPGLNAAAAAAGESVPPAGQHAPLLQGYPQQQQQGYPAQIAGQHAVQPVVGGMGQHPQQQQQLGAAEGKAGLTGAAAPQPLAAEMAAAGAGGGGAVTGAGGKGGRGRRNSNAAAATGRKLRLSKV